MNLLDVLKLDDGGVIDALFKLIHFGPQEDGGLPSKAGFAWLCEQGFAVKDYDKPLPNALTRKGLNLFLDLTKEEVKTLNEDYARLQFTNYIRIGYCVRQREMNGYDKPFILPCTEYAMGKAREWMTNDLRLVVDQTDRERDYWTVKFHTELNQGHKTLTLGPGDLIMLLEHDEYPMVYAHTLD